MGITALISTLIGLVGGALPRILGIVEGRANHRRELEFLKLQHEQQLERAKLEAGAKLREAESALVAEEVRAMREHLTAIIEAQAKPTGIAWIDGFNAVLRPAATTLILVVFFGTALVYVASAVAMWRAGAVTGVEFAQMVWGGMIGLSIEGALGFLFGVRTTGKRA